MPNRKLMLLAGLGGVLVSLLYILGFWTPGDQKVSVWGLFCLGLSFGLIVLVWMNLLKRRVNTGFLALGFALLAVLQLVPIQQALAFYDYDFKEGLVFSLMMVHWLYISFHAAVLALSLVALYQLCHRLLTQ